MNTQKTLEMAVSVRLEIANTIISLQWGLSVQKPPNGHQILSNASAKKRNMKQYEQNQLVQFYLLQPKLVPKKPPNKQNIWEVYQRTIRIQ